MNPPQEGQSPVPPPSSSPLPPSSPSPSPMGPAPRSPSGEVGPAPSYPPAGGEVGPPPSPPIDIKTMASDTESLAASGGLETKPRTFTPGDLIREPVFTPEATSPVTPSGSAGLPQQRILLISLGIIVLLAILGVVVYLWAIPKFFPSQEISEEGTAPTPEATTPLPSAPVTEHQSFFLQEPSVKGEVNLNQLTLDELNVSLKPASDSILPKDSIKEISLKADGKLVASYGLLQLLLQGSGVETIFEDDLTGFLYFDEKTAWPGYIFRLKESQDLDSAKVAVANIEKTVNFAVFYPTDPGVPSKAGFKNGKSGDLPTRYLTFPQANISFVYGWSDNYLIFSTSFDGFKKALGLLQSEE